MKNKLFAALTLALLSTLNPQLSTLFAQGTAFTYQGRLNDGASPATGIYDLQFTIYDALASGSQIGGTLTSTATAVSNGLFTVTLDFGAGVFNGADRWLEVGVRTNGSAGAYSTLSPRQAVTPSPYAIFATTSGTASNVVNGSVVKSLNGLRDDVTLAAGTNMTITPNGNTLTLAAVGAGGSGIWSVLNNNAYYNAGNVGIGTTTPSTYGHGGTARILEVNNSGTTLNSQAHLMLYSGVSSLADSAMGTVTWAQPGGMAAYIGAQTRSTTPNMPSAMLTFGTRKSGEASASPKMVITEDGNVGIGTTTPTRAKVEINGYSGFYAYGQRGILNSSGATSGSNTGADVSASLWASGNVWASAFLAFSDERIKRIEGRSDATRDLSTLLGIEVTDYTYIDTVSKGAGKQKRVVAQQVEKVYPQAVSRTTDVVPDIYEKAGVKNGWVKLATNLKKGERVRLIGEKKEGIHEVLEVAQDKFRTDFAADGDEVFVYGREVKDFRSVDYEAVAMLNVSATQELSRRVEKQAAEIAARDGRIATLEKANQEMQRELAAQKELASHMQAEFATLHKAVARLADKTAGTFALNHE